MINCDLSILIFTRYFNVILMRNRKNLEKHYIFKTIWLNIIIIHRHWKTNSSGNARALDFFKSDYMFTFLLRSFSMCIFYINVHHFFFTRWDSVISFSRRGILISHCYQFIVVLPRVISTKTLYLSLYILRIYNIPTSFETTITYT